MGGSPRRARWYDDPLLRWLIGVAISLVLLHLLLYLLFWPGQPIVVFTWFIPAVVTFVMLASASITFLSFGRYRVLRQPSYFWIGVAFSSFVVLNSFLILTFPDLAGQGQGLISQIPNTSAWMASLSTSFLLISLQAAVLAHWPRPGAIGERWWFWLWIAVIVIAVSIASLSVAFEQSLPLLVVNGSFTSLYTGVYYAFVVVSVAGSVLATRRYLQTADSFFGYLTLTELVLAFAYLDTGTALVRYSPLWYLGSLLTIPALAIMLFGLLSEYVGLYRRERQRTRELDALQRLTDPYLARLEVESLLKSLLERMVAIMGAHAGAILLLDSDRKELVIRSTVGISEEQAIGLRVKVGEDFAGKVVTRGGPFWVRDAQADPSVTSTYIKNNNIRGIIGVPMSIGEEVIGVVHVDFLVARDFGRQDARLLEVVAERAALAIYQARLLEDTREERNRLQAVLDTAPVGIAFHEAPSGHLQLHNKAFETILGRPVVTEMSIAEQAAYFGLSRPTGEPFLPEELPGARALRGETVVGEEELIQHPSGRKVFLLVNSAPLRDAKGQIVGAITVFQDITRIKEQELLRDEFISAVAHELRTPVTTIKGYAQLMRRWTPQECLARQPQAIEVIDAQTDRINRRVQEMLEAVRFRKAPPELHTVHFDLSRLVSEVIRRMRAVTEKHRFLVELGGPAPVKADRERVEEVLVSLLDNAIKFSPKGGDIEVRVWTDQRQAMVSVTDHGAGIPKERQPHIFEPFFEPVPAGTPGYRGVVALSLYLSKLIIERHKGRIWFESEVGRGSTFYFALPLAT